MRFKERCSIREALEQKLADGINTMYKAKRDVEAARTRGMPNVSELSEALDVAMHNAIKTQRDFNQHISDHQCQE